MIANRSEPRGPSASLLLIAAFALVLGASTAMAAGGGGGGGGNDSSWGSDDPDIANMIANAEDHIEKWEYEAAIDDLEDALDEEPDNPDVLNYLGYSHRRLGETDIALEYYLAALEEEPEHRGANEYLGELYLEMDQLEMAEERLAVLADICDSDCEEYDMLVDAIAQYKEMNGLS